MASRTDQKQEAPPILVAEDDQATREMLCTILHKRFPESRIYFAENGMEGVAVFREHRPEIVITDIKMPIMDGVQMADMIKEISPETKFIVLTAFSSAAYVNRFNELGCIAYITKPVLFKNLFEAVQKCVNEITN